MGLMLSFTLTVHDRFCVAHLDGLVTLEGWEAVLGELGAAWATAKAPPCLVIDMREAVGYLGVPERKTVGALMARHFTEMTKVAIVVQAHKITNVVRGEAQRNGLDLQLFPAYADAVAWVTS
jgi:hypothetical protein